MDILNFSLRNGYAITKKYFATRLRCQPEILKFLTPKFMGLPVPQSEQKTEELSEAVTKYPCLSGYDKASLQINYASQEELLTSNKER